MLTLSEWGLQLEVGSWESLGRYNYTISENTNSPIKKNDGGKWWSKRSVGSVCMCVMECHYTL